MWRNFLGPTPLESTPKLIPKIKARDKSVSSFWCRWYKSLQQLPTLVVSCAVVLTVASAEKISSQRIVFGGGESRENLRYRQPEVISYRQPEVISYRQPEVISYRQPEVSYRQPDHNTRPQYQFSWNVQDDYAGIDMGHQERREDYDTQGSYRVLLPDGRIQTVTYTVSGDSGYLADVQYSGEARYDDISNRYAQPQRPRYS
ncbi:unnamed protein product [Cyprideis torosa]|uniref:Uncharacterized protein n=1 Tax=Cyprideis torosa TaxID=163714 RepID=A0A7R8WIW5_9CRUS|nr:unnamed protein product [Cyprideis torosa]CAG0894970.1 unnamed protein product [Cyprideis torosa]